jgi:hypothetical protein
MKPKIISEYDYDISHCERLGEYYLMYRGELLGAFNTMSGAEAEMEYDMAARRGDVETIRVTIKHAKTLRELFEALCALEANIEEDERAEDYGIDICELPIFGGEQPSATDGVWSWDEDQLLVGEGNFSEWYLIDREEWESARPSRREVSR